MGLNIRLIKEELLNFLFEGEESKPLVVDCSVDKIDISVDRNLLLGDFSDLRIQIEGFWESSYCQSWESSTHNIYRASLGSCGFKRQVNILFMWAFLS